jgi:Iap family predicted aminopeptidase
MQYDPGVPQIPAAAVSTFEAGVLSALIKKEKAVSVSLRMNCRDMGRVASANVVGELTGIELPDEVILVGGHLDSWDLGLGAHDDAAGCAASLEALRLIKAVGLRPRRTIRVVLFMDEEFGGKANAISSRRNRTGAASSLSGSRSEVATARSSKKSLLTEASSSRSACRSSSPGEGE